MSFITFAKALFSIGTQAAPGDIALAPAAATLIKSAAILIIGAIALLLIGHGIIMWIERKGR